MRIYTASKLAHADFFLELRMKFPKIHFTARWPLMHLKVPDNQEFAKQFWQDDYDDIARSDVVLVWGKSEDRLRGALVEAGIGIALGKGVALVGKHEDFGTWQYHPRCQVFKDSTIEQVLYNEHWLRS